MSKPLLLDQDDVLIIGAGPAGLTAAYHLTQNSALKVRILEANAEYVGGISRTEKYQGFSFDIGGHRFFTKSDEIENLWREILPKDFKKKSRLSRIYYKNRFYSYPLKPFEALKNLGLTESALCIASYLQARLHPTQNPQTFEQWVSNKFGKRLFSIFFKTYTEKVWGISTELLSADWAAQRIKGLSLGTALKTSFAKPSSQPKKNSVKSLTNSFFYPTLGPGMMWEEAARKVKEKGGKIDMGRKAIQFHWSEKAEMWSVSAMGVDKIPQTYLAKQLLCSAPWRKLVSSLTPHLPCKEKVRALR